ncbi:hypothetical protein ACILG0_19525 [Pseudomonadota bacterium AL_CKDN230030165-1A_HGKHYDSX7]
MASSSRILQGGETNRYADGIVGNALRFMAIYRGFFFQEAVRSGFVATEAVFFNRLQK